MPDSGCAWNVLVPGSLGLTHVQAQIDRVHSFNYLEAQGAFCQDGCYSLLFSEQGNKWR